MDIFLIIAKIFLIYITIGVFFAIVVELFVSSSTEAEVAVEIWLWPMLLPTVIILGVYKGTIWVIKKVRDLGHKSD